MVQIRGECDAGGVFKMFRTSPCITVIPAYNEEETILRVVEAAKRYTDVCVIDDCSSDFTPEILNRVPGIQVIRHERNTHLPGCLRDGMRYAVEHGYRYAIFMDAGLSHNPDEIPLFVEQAPSDLLIGCRTMKLHTPLGRDLLSRVGNFIYNVCLDFPRSLFGPYYRDLTSGFRRYSSRAMKLLLAEGMRSRSFDVMLESASLVRKNKLTISEVPITYRFTNSSLNGRAIVDALYMCVRLLLHAAGYHAAGGIASALHIRR
jgi:dolichol-phosphate mannosyltransferase